MGTTVVGVAVVGPVVVGLVMGVGNAEGSFVVGNGEGEGRRYET